MVSTGSSWMKGLFPNIDLSFSYWEKIKEGFSPEVLGSLRTEEHHEKSVLWRWSGQRLQGSSLNYLFIYLSTYLPVWFFLSVWVHVCIHVCEDVLVSPVSFQSPRMTLASSSIVHCLLWGQGFLLGPKHAVSGRTPASPRELLSSHFKALPDSACMWVLETGTQVLELEQ